MTTQTITLTAYGQQVAQLIADRKVSFFDDGLEAGSGTYGVELSFDIQRAGIATKEQTGGIINGMIEAGFFNIFDYEGDSYVELTPAAAAYFEAL